MPNPPHCGRERTLSEDQDEDRRPMPDRQPHYRMGAVARMTGLSPHTIRVWERRYGALQPSRSPGGDRLYTESEVQRLRLLQQLKAAGHAIGTVAHLPTAELERILAASRASAPPAEPAPQSDQDGPVPALNAARTRFLNAITVLDTQSADRILAQLVGALELHPLIHGFLVPLFEEIGDSWAQGRLTAAQEHAASAILRNQLAMLLRLYPGPPGYRCVVVGTPKGEWHEFGALLVALVAGSHGWRVVYLGANLPAGEIAAAARRVQPEKVLLSWVCADVEDTLAELAGLREQLPDVVTLLVGGRQAQAPDQLPPGITRVRDLAELERLLALG